MYTQLNQNGRKDGGNQFIPPMSVVEFFNMNKKQQRALVGDEAFETLSMAFKNVEQGICVYLSNICLVPFKFTWAKANPIVPFCSYEHSTPNEWKPWIYWTW